MSGTRGDERGSTVSDDERDIERLLLRYASAVDDRDWDMFRDCFTEEVDADYGDIGSWGSAGELTEFMVAAHAGFGTSHHMVTNVVVDLDGDAATSRCHVHAVLTLLEDPNRWFDTVGSYRDHLVRTPAGWRIAARTFRATRIISGP